MTLIFILIVAVGIYFNYRYLKNVKKKYIQLRANDQKADQQVFQRAVDNGVFYCYLAYRLTAIHKMSKKKFEQEILFSYDNLPVRGGGFGTREFPGFWDNIMTTHDLNPEYDEQGRSTITDLAGKKLANTLWLNYEHDLNREKKKVTTDIDYSDLYKKES